MPIHDNRSQESDIGMIQNFHHCYKLIDNKLSIMNVLIHCRAGMQRSVALLALYLMKKINIHLIKLNQLLKRKMYCFLSYGKFYRPIKYFETKFINYILIDN